MTQRPTRLTIIEEAGTLPHAGKQVLCRCTCGTVLKRTRCDVVSGRIKSCGCLKRELVGNITRLPPGEAAFNNLFRNYARHAAARNRSFSLTGEEFRALVSGNCHYCGVAGRSVRRQDRKSSNGDFWFTGIDRVDNALGYVSGNCVACCATCNRAKLCQTEADFLGWIKRVHDFRNLG